MPIGSAMLFAKKLSFRQKLQFERISVSVLRAREALPSIWRRVLRDPLTFPYKRFRLGGAPPTFVSEWNGAYLPKTLE